MDNIFARYIDWSTGLTVFEKYITFIPRVGDFIYYKNSFNQNIVDHYEVKEVDYHYSDDVETLVIIYINR